MGTESTNPRLTDPKTHPYQFVSVEQLADYWFVTERVVYAQIRKGALKAKKFGPYLRINISDVVTYGDPPEDQTCT